MSAAERMRTVPQTKSGPDRDWVMIGMAALTILGAIAAGILAADVGILAVAAAGSLALGVAIILRPDVATLTTIFILYSNTAVVAVKFHGVPLFVGAAVPLLLVVPLARDLVVRRLPVVAPPMLGWMLVLLIIHLVSALGSANLTRSWDAVVVFAIEGFGLYFLLINVVRTPEMLRQVTWVLLAAGAFISIFSIHQDLTNNYDSNYWGLAQRRLTGSIGETNRFAQVMLMLVPLGIFRFTGERRHVLRMTAGIMTAIITLGVVLTFSRGAAVGLGVLVVALALLRMVRIRHLAVLVLGLAVVLAAFPQYALRIGSIAQVGALADQDASRSEVGGAILSRATETLAAALVIVDHPVLGVGPDMFNENYQAYAEVVGILVKQGATREAHNLYLGIGAELGLVGLAVFLWIGIQTMGMIAKARRLSIRRRPDLEQLTTPFALALLTYYVTGLFLHLSFARFYFLMLALAGAAAVITLREMAAEDAREGPGRNDAAAAQPASPDTSGGLPAT
jgi:putative inorganic carbon (HCO3(-)) transporter